MEEGALPLFIPPGGFNLSSPGSIRPRQQQNVSSGGLNPGTTDPPCTLIGTYQSLYVHPPPSCVAALSASLMCSEIHSDFTEVVLLPSESLLSCEMAALCKVTVRWVASQNAKVLRKLPRKDGTGQGERMGRTGKRFKGGVCART